MAETELRLPSVKARIGLSRSTIYSLMARGTLPRPIALGARAVGWLESEIEAWLAMRIEISRGHVTRVELEATPIAGHSTLEE